MGRDVKRVAPQTSGATIDHNFGGGGSGGGGADQNLSNLLATFINQDLKPDTAGLRNLGTDSKPWGSVANAGSYLFTHFPGAGNPSAMFWIDGIGPSFADGALVGQLILDLHLLSANHTLQAPNADGVIATQAFVAAALGFKADLNSPIFTGNPQGPTPAPGDNDTSLATTAFVAAAILAAGGGGANTALSNLIATSINQNLSPSVTDVKTIGDNLFRWLAVKLAGNAAITFGPAGTQDLWAHTHGTGPLWGDATVGKSIQHNMQSLTVNRTITWPNNSGTLALLSDIAASGANKNLSNLLAATSINVDLLPDVAGTRVIGSAAKPFIGIVGMQSFNLIGATGQDNFFSWSNVAAGGNVHKGPVFGDGDLGLNFTIDMQALTANRTFRLPSATGGDFVICVTPGIGSAVGGAATALPLNPLGYYRWNLPDGTLVATPYYSAF